MDRIVVGVDGSEESVDALRFALDETRLHGARLQIVNAWRFPALTMLPVAPPPPTPQELDQAAREVIDRALTDAGGAGTVNVELVAVEGHPVEALVDAAQGADLLVVAARGLGGFRSTLLGSVSQQCALHAPCPVVIVRKNAS